MGSGSCTTHAVHTAATAADRLLHRQHHWQRLWLYMFRVLLYNTAAAAADRLRTQTAPLASPVAPASHI